MKHVRVTGLPTNPDRSLLLCSVRNYKGGYMGKRPGLDLGANSIGWAILETNEDGPADQPGLCHGVERRPGISFSEFTDRIPDTAAQASGTRHRASRTCRRNNSGCPCFGARNRPSGWRRGIQYVA